MTTVNADVIERVIVAATAVRSVTSRADDVTDGSMSKMIVGTEGSTVSCGRVRLTADRDRGRLLQGSTTLSVYDRRVTESR